MISDIVLWRKVSDDIKTQISNFVTEYKIIFVDSKIKVKKHECIIEVPFCVYNLINVVDIINMEFINKYAYIHTVLKFIPIYAIKNGLTKLYSKEQFKVILYIRIPYTETLRLAALHKIWLRSHVSKIYFNTTTEEYKVVVDLFDYMHLIKLLRELKNELVLFYTEPKLNNIV